MVTKMSMNNIDVLDLIDTLELYGLINDGIDKYNNRNTVQGFINDMVSNTNVSTKVHNSNKATYTKQDEINDLNDLNEDQLHLRNGLGDNITDTDNTNNHENTNLADNGLTSNKRLVPTS